MMRMSEPSPASPPLSTKDRKTVQTAPSKVSLVVQRMLLPLLDFPVAPHVVFEAEPVGAGDLEADLMRRLLRDQPACDREGFLERAGRLFDSCAAAGQAADSCI